MKLLYALMICTAMAHSTFMHAMLTMPKTERKHSRYMQVSRKPLASIHEEPVSTKNTAPVAAAAPRTLYRKRVKAKRRPLATVTDPKQPKNPIATAPLAPVPTADAERKQSASDFPLDAIAKLNAKPAASREEYLARQRQILELTLPSYQALYKELLKKGPQKEQLLTKKRYETIDNIRAYMASKGRGFTAEEIDKLKEDSRNQSHKLFNLVTQKAEAKLTEQEKNEFHIEFIDSLEAFEDSLDTSCVTAEDILKNIKRIEKRLKCPCLDTGKHCIHCDAFDLRELDAE